MEFHFRKSSNDYLQDSFYHEMITIGSLSHPIITFCSLNHWWSQSEFLIIWWLQSIVLIPIISLFITSLLNRNQWSLSSNDLITIYTPDHFFYDNWIIIVNYHHFMTKKHNFQGNFWGNHKSFTMSPSNDHNTVFIIWWLQCGVFIIWQLHYRGFITRKSSYQKFVQDFVQKICTKFCTKNLYKTLYKKFV